MNGKKKKIMMFIPSLGVGGAEHAFLTLAEGFALRNYQVDLVLSSAVGRNMELVAQGIRVFDLDSSHVSLSIVGLIRYLNNARPDVILSTMPHANVVAIIANIFAKHEALVAVTETSTWSQVLKYEGSTKEKILFLFSKALYPKAGVIIAVSDGVAHDLHTAMRLPKGKLIRIYNPVVTPKLIALASEPSSHRWLMKKDVPVILSLGRLELAKDYPILLEAFSLLRKKIECRLIIVGDGSERNRLDQLTIDLGIQADVDLIRFVENPYSLMANADIFVLSSRYEGLPSVLIEALACGVPIVSTNCKNGPAEILENGKFGTLVPVGDAKALSDGIQKAIASSYDPAVLKERAKIFSVEKSMEYYVRVLMDN